MKILSHFFILALFVALVACEFEKTGEETPPEKEAVEDTSRLEVSVDDKLYAIIKNDSGVFRGVNFGMTVSQVRALEDPSLLGEDTLNYLNYLIAFNANEEADILYYFDRQKKINGIEVNIYPENQESQRALFNAFGAYFDKKYGSASVPNQDDEIWTTKDNKILIVMKKTGNDKVHDIKIDFRLTKAPSAKI